MNRLVMIALSLFFASCLNPENVPSGSANQTASSKSTVTTPQKNDAGMEGSMMPITVSTSESIDRSMVTRHLPGTLITTATGKYTYLLKSDGSAAAFASAALVTASGYKTAMVVTVTAEELYCYKTGAQITAAIAASPAGVLRDGALVKEKSRSDTYAISDGIAWPIINGTVFAKAGYDFANVVVLADGSLAGRVSGIGSCVAGVACLDDEYLSTCAQDIVGDLAPTAIATSTATAAETSVATSTPANTATNSSSVTTVAVTNTATQTVAPSATVTVTVTATAVSTGTATSSATGIPINTATNTATSVATTTTATNSSSNAVTASSTATLTAAATATLTSLVPDFSWAWDDVGTKLCANAAYFIGGSKAVLLIWEGPGTDSAKGPVGTQSFDRICWDFAGREKGLYRFWADVPVASCGANVCARDTIDGNGAMYMQASKVTGAARKWLYCLPTGCDGEAYWDGQSFTPMGNQ